MGGSVGGTSKFPFLWIFLSKHPPSSGGQEGGRSGFCSARAVTAWLGFLPNARAPDWREEVGLCHFGSQSVMKWYWLVEAVIKMY